MEKIKTADEWLQRYAKHPKLISREAAMEGYGEYVAFKSTQKERIEEARKEGCETGVRNALELAAEKAKVAYLTNHIVVDKSSILSLEKELLKNE